MTATKYELDTKTQIECRKGMNSVSKDWGSIGFLYIGSKNPDLARVHNELTNQGFSEWEGFTLVHPDYG